MPTTYCPRCAKKFKTQAALLQHMNQPISSCLTHYQERINMAVSLQTAVPVEPTYSPPENHMDIDDPEAHRAQVHTSSALSADSIPPLFQRLPTELENRNTVTPELPSFTIKRHPTSGKVFGHGTTFLDQFDSDKFSDARKHGCLYYPFASRKEWELASFFLNSSLSMASIDCFLKLGLVSLEVFHEYIVAHTSLLGQGYGTFLWNSERFAQSSRNSSTGSFMEKRSMEHYFSNQIQIIPVSSRSHRLSSSHHA